MRCYCSRCLRSLDDRARAARIVDESTRRLDRWAREDAREFTRAPKMSGAEAVDAICPGAAARLREAGKVP